MKMEVMNGALSQNGDWLIGAKSEITSIDRIMGVFFILSLSISPIYLFPSGQPQVADIMLIVWSILVIILNPKVSITGTEKKFLGYTLLFVYYISLVSLLWGFFLSNLGVVYNLLYYLFNLIIILALGIMINRNNQYWRRTIQYSLFFSTLVCLLSFIYYYDPSTLRQTAGFNNPNQLGYYSLLMFSASIVVFGGKGVKDVKFWFITTVSSLLVLTSLSLTANVALSFSILGLLLLVKANKILLKFMMGLIIIFLASSFLFTTDFGIKLSEGIDTRINTIERKTENTLESRGYNRIWDFPQYNFLGAGEGARDRFGSNNMHEIHSSIGTILFSYGIPGLLLFLLMIYTLLRKAPVWVFFIIATPFAYSLTHQGLRTTLFWILLLFICYFGQKKITSN